MFCFTVRRGKVQAMTEREELMLYHGIMIGRLGVRNEPPAWAKPWIAEVVKRYDDAARTETAREIQDRFIAVATKALGGEN